MTFDFTEDMIKEAHFSIQLLHPKFWPLWIALFLGYTLSLLPIRFQMMLGKGIGQLLIWIPNHRARIARINIQKCFPQKTPTEHQKLWQHNMYETGRAVFDSVNAWFWSDRKVKQHMQISGLHYSEPVQKEQGVLYFAVHHLSLDMGARIINLHQPCVSVYRPHNNALLDYIQVKCRIHQAKGLIPKHDTRSMVKALRQRSFMLYMADQSVSGSRHIFAPFLGVKAAHTITATSTLAHLGKAKVIPISVRRSKQHRYCVQIESELPNFPTKDTEQDTYKANQVIGHMIENNISQYLWMHRRFKKRPAHEREDFYL